MDWERLVIAVSKLYTNFIIRDFFAYVIPGWVFLSIALYQPSDFQGLYCYLLNSINWVNPVLIPTLIFSYITGRILQDIGMITVLFWDRSLPLGVWDYRTRKEYFVAERRIKEITRNDKVYGEGERMYRERINALKLMCGNLTMALFLGFAINKYNGVVMNPILWLIPLITGISHVILAFNKREWENINWPVPNEPPL